MMLKLPPIEKIYEAFSAIADNRIELLEGKARIVSSDYKKVYTVTWNGSVYGSNDNPTYWQRYAGYPIIGVLMLQGKLPYNMETATLFKGINWKLLNTEAKNQYATVLNDIFDRLSLSRERRDDIHHEVQHIYDELAILNISVCRVMVKPEVLSE